MRLTDIIKKLSPPSSLQTSHQNVSARNQKSDSSLKPDAFVDMHEMGKSVFKETPKEEGIGEINRHAEGVIGVPLSDKDTADKEYAKQEEPIETDDEPIEAETEVIYKVYKKLEPRFEIGQLGDDVSFIQELKAINNFLLEIVENRKPDISAVTSVADQIIDSLRKDDNLVRFIFAKKCEDDITSHLIDVAIIATKIGLSIGYNSNEIKMLAICALLHDIGMLRLPEAIFMKKGKLTKEELSEVKRHPEYSYEILKNLDLPLIVAEVAYQEQEREDGSGYPRGLKGDAIHEYAKIIGLADTYAAMLQPRPQRDRKIPFEIIKEIVGTYKKQFSIHLIKVLMDEFSIFPVGLYVKLNTGALAKVIRVNKLAPMRPTVEVLIDSNGKRLEKPLEYDLIKEPILQIMDTSFELD